jgi:hypothetical protein
MTQKKQYLITLTPTINNLFITINSTKGHLYRSFSFASVKITASDHRKRKLFAQEFGTHFGNYLTKLKLNATFKINIKGTDPRTFSFLEFFIKAGGSFYEINFTPKASFNGCTAIKKKRI